MPVARPCVSCTLHAVLQQSHRACRQLEGWKQHKPLWQESKAAVLEKFAARCPDTAGWEQQMRQYSTLAAELTAQVLRFLRCIRNAHQRYGTERDSGSAAQRPDTGRASVPQEACYCEA